MKFQAALKILDIEDYGERIFNSNSNGELYHLADYIWLAENLVPEDAQNFRQWFERLVGFAQDEWRRPESIFQHVMQFFVESVT